MPEWGGLLQDTVSPMGDMVHYLAKASFLQDMLLGMFVFILQKLAFCKMLLGMFVWVFFVCNHFCSAFTPSIGLTSI
jgi:hypothetical protein